MIESTIANAFDALWAKSSERNWIYGRLGRPNGSAFLYDVPGQPGYKYVMKGSEGTEGLVTAQDRIGVAPVANQRVKMRREYGHLVIREAEQIAGGGGGGGSNTLAGLYDVSLTSLADGNMLQYSASASKWVNVMPSGGGGGASNLNALTDVTLSSVANLNYLIYNSGSSQWINAVPSHTDLTGIGVNQHHDRAHDIITGDTSGAVHTIVGSAFQLVGATATNTLGLLTPSSNPGSGAAILRTDSAGGITIGGGMFVVTPSTHQVTIDGTTFAVDSTLHTLTIGGATTFNNNAVFNNPTRFNALATFNTNLTFVTADRMITSDAGIDVTWDLGTSGTPGDLILASPKRFRSADFLDDIPIAGFGLLINSANDRQLTINTIKSDSLHTRLFVADGVRIDISEERWGKSMGIVHDDFTSPAAIGGTVPVFFENSPILTGALFSNNDWILLRYLNNATTFAYGSVWGQVSAYTDMGLDADRRGYQRWTFTMRHGDTSTLIKKGNVAIDYGVSGQGYVYLSTLGDANGPWFRIGTWSGSDPFTAGNTQIRTQIGRLDGIADAALNPTGYGLYSDNAYLHGMVRTAETVMNDDGLAIEYNNVTDPNAIFGAHSVIAWWPNVDSRIGNPAASVAAAKDISVPANHSDTLFLHAWKAPDSYNATVSLKAVNPSDVTYGGSAIVLDTLGNMQFQSAQMQFFGHALPVSDITYDLGAASLRWRTLYVHTLTADTVTGAALGGQTWTYPASMTIDAVSSGPTTVSVTNSGVGAASLDVEANITLGGTIDGVDLSAHVANPNAHHHIAQTGDGITVDPATQVVAVDGTVVRTPATVVRNTFTINTAAPLTGGGTLATSPLNLALNLATPSGLTITGGLAVADTLAGVGLTMTAKVLAIDFSQVARATTQMIAGAGLTGGGDLSANRTFNVVAGDGTLVVNADELHVNQAFNFAWSGNHTFSTGAVQFNTDPQLNSNLDFIGTERNITTASAANLNIIPAGDLVLYPTGRDVYPGGNGLINLGGYNRKWSTLYASELYVETLVASNVMATIGGRVMITPTSNLIADFPIGATTISLKHNSFVAGTWLYLENVVSGIPQNEAVKLSSGPTTITGGYSYTCTRGTGAPYTSVGPRNWVVGDAVVSLGAAVNDGYIDQASLQTIHTKVGPTITIYSRTALTNWNDTAPVVSMGNLNGFAGLGSVYGFAAGNNLTLAPSTGFSGFTADAIGGLKMYNTPIVLYNGANKVIAITKEDGVQFDNDTSVGTPAWLRWYADLDTATSTNAVASITTGYAGVSGTATLNIRAGAGGTAGHNGLIQMSVDDNISNYTSYLSMQDYRLVNTAGNVNFIVLYGGNVGLGNATPATKLDVAGTLRSTVFNPPASGAGLELSYGSGVGYLFSYDRSGSAYQTLRLEGSPAIINFGSAANVGIGTNAPANKLDVAGMIRTTTGGIPATGVGLELYYVSASNYSQINSYDRTGAAYKALRLDGSLLVLNANSHGNAVMGQIGIIDPSGGAVAAGGSIFQIASPTAAAGNSQYSVLDLQANRTSGSALTGAIMFSNQALAASDKRLAEIAGLTGTTNDDGTLVFYTMLNGSLGEAMRLTESNSLGIGTAAPACALDVAGTLRSTVFNPPASGAGLELSYGSGVGYLFSYDRSGSAYQTLRLEGSPAIINFGSAANVGIGTNAPANKLDVAGMIRTTTGGIPATGVGMELYYVTASSYSQINSFDRGASLYKGLRVDGLTLSLNGNSAGNVGVGNVAPTTKLDVTGTIRSTTNTTPSAGVGLELYYVSASNYSQINSFDRGAGQYKDMRIDGLTLQLNGSSSGNVGIGTATPGSQLDVAGVIRSTSSANAPTTGSGLQIYYNSGSSFGSVAAFTQPSTYQELRIDGNILKLNASSNNPVGVATPNPIGQLGVETTSTLASPRPGISSSMYSDNFGAFTGQAHILTRSARGPKGGTLTGTLASDNIFALEAYGSNSGNTFMNVPSFAMYARASEAYNNGQTNGGAALDIYLRATATTGSPVAPVLTILGGTSNASVDTRGDATLYGDLTINAKGETTTAPFLGGQVFINNMPQPSGSPTQVVIDGLNRLAKSVSSLRYKSNVREMPATFGPEFVMRLRPVMYKRKGEEDGADFVGFIGEEVLEAGGTPFLTFNQDGQVESLRYDELSAPLVATAQQQQRRILELERRLAELERKLAA